MQVFVLERVIPPLMITFKSWAVNSVASNHIFALFLFLFNSHYLKRVSMDPDQNPSIIKEYPWTSSMTAHGTGPKWVSMDPWSMFCPLQSNYRIEFSNLSFPIAHLSAGMLTCENSGQIFVADPPSSGFMNGGRQNSPPPPQFTQVAWASARRLIAHLIAYIKSINAMGDCCYGFDLSMFMLILQHSVWSRSLWCFWSLYMLFNCYFKECFNAKGQNGSPMLLLTITLIIFELRGSRGSKCGGSTPCKYDHSP